MDYYSEEDTKANILEPIIQEKWPVDHITREYSYTDGRIKVVGQVAHRDKGSRKRVDYVLWEDRAAQKILAIIEAESNEHDDSYGFSQARDYAEDLDVPFVFASSGRNMWHFKNRLTQEESTILLNKLPSFEDLLTLQGVAPKETLEPYYVESGENPREPRYYQRNAINAAVESIISGQKKNLLVMATGTGKTYTAFQIIYRLLNAKVKKHILYLADRDVLITQTMNDDFAPFVEDGIITRVGKGKEKVETAYQIHMALYQQLSSNEVYKQFKPGFFDLIVIDEAHRGGGNTQSSWHDILDYFDTDN
ncbi:MAG: DEAD/DEAH box helicase family protein, partial [Weissella confusa]|nr:DEAD/DEAH box helicase family protein [Weissella confusa]